MSKSKFRLDPPAFLDSFAFAIAADIAIENSAATLPAFLNFLDYLHRFGILGGSGLPAPAPPHTPATTLLNRDEKAGTMLVFRYLFLTAALGTILEGCACAAVVSFLNFDRETVKSIAGQTFPWASGGLSGTITIRPAGPIDALTDTTPSVGNGRAPRSSFYIGLQSAGGPVGASFEFIFDKPVDITIYNTETLVGRERMTYQTDGDPWTGGWYENTGTLVGLGTRTVQLTPIPPTPPYGYAALSSKNVTRFEYLNEHLLLPGVPGRVGNGIELQIDSVAIPEPSSACLLVFAHFAAGILWRSRQGRNRERERFSDSNYSRMPS